MQFQISFGLILYSFLFSWCTRIFPWGFLVSVRSLNHQSSFYHQQKKADTCLRGQIIKGKTKVSFTGKRSFSLWMLPHPWSMFKKSFTKCMFDKIDIIQHLLYIISIIYCRYQNGTLISIAILFCFLNNKPISQKNYVYMIIIPFCILSLVKIYVI